MCKHASWMTEAQCSICTPPPKPVRPEKYEPTDRCAAKIHDKRTLPYCSNLIRHSEHQTARVESMLTPEGAHRIFHTNGNRGHIGNVDTTTGQPYQPSIRRFIWDLEHRNDPALETEIVRVTCEHLGNPSTGDGCCVTHLEKVLVEF